MARILVTGGSGFIGSNFLNLMVPRHPEHSFLNVDCLTYAALPGNVHIENEPNYIFSKTDICDKPMMSKIFEIFRPHWIVHFAAISHVDRSIDSPDECVRTNILGTLNLLDICRMNWKTLDDKVFLQVGTDEVYGDLAAGAIPSTEDTPYKPSTPYAASKAAADHFVKIYHRTYGIPGRITNCTNNFGLNQHDEKLIPKMIGLAARGLPLTLHGTGSHIRDWLWAEDHCEAIWLVLTRGKNGESYNVGGGKELTNLEIVDKICQFTALRYDRPYLELKELITFVPDRPGNDLRYALDFSKIKNELGWEPKMLFETGLATLLSNPLKSDPLAWLDYC